MISRRPPDPLPRFYRWRTNVLQAPLFFLHTGICGSCSLFVSLWDRSGRLQHRIAQIWARGCIRISGARLTVRGADHLRKHVAAVYAGNHTSYMDTPVIFSTLPFQFEFSPRRNCGPCPSLAGTSIAPGRFPSIL